MEAKLKWSNLREGNCPKCGHVLSELEKELVCKKCKFMISISKYHKIMHNSDPYPIKRYKNTDEYQNNLSALNNL